MARETQEIHAYQHDLMMMMMDWGLHSDLLSFCLDVATSLYEWGTQ